MSERKRYVYATILGIMLTFPAHAQILPDGCDLEQKGDVMVSNC